MKGIYLIIPLCLALGACSYSHHPDFKPEPPKSTPSMMHYSQDNKGRNAFAKTRAGSGKRVFVFSPKHTAWAVYDENGRRVKTGRASGGKGYCPDIGRSCRTVTGKFRIYSKKGAGCESGKYPIDQGGGAPMPYCMHFNGGYAIHGSYHVPDYNASHGCIRVLPSAAKWLNTKFLRNGSQVIVQPY